MHDLTALQRDLLYVIVGLDVRDELEKYYGKPVGNSQLYPNLEHLEDKGLVVKGDRDGRTNPYALRDRGERELENHLDWKQQHVDLAGKLGDEL